MTTTDDVLGKVVIDSSGRKVGVATTLHFDKESYTLTGISVDQGFGNGFCYVTIKAVKLFGEDAVFLNKKALTQLIGKKAFDEEGQYVGTVDRVDTDNPKIIILTNEERTISLPRRRIKHQGDSLIVKS